MVEVEITLNVALEIIVQYCISLSCWLTFSRYCLCDNYNLCSHLVNIIYKVILVRHRCALLELRASLAASLGHAHLPSETLFVMQSEQGVLRHVSRLDRHLHQKQCWKSSKWPGLWIELLGLVAESERTILRSLSLTKPGSSIPKPVNDLGLSAFLYQTEDERSLCTFM